MRSLCSQIPALFNRIKSSIPYRFRRALYPLYYSLVDGYETLFGLREDLVPPKRVLARYWRSVRFHGAGRMYLRHLVNLGGMKPDDRVLDVGCGIGRVAVPLTDYIVGEGEYQGFDIISQGIDWCQDNITPRFPNFHFQLADLYNSNYNPRGRFTARDYSFPYQDAYFDFVYLTSVFTHMLPPEVDHYLSEIGRVLKPGGRTLITFFLLYPLSRAFIKAGASHLDFKHEWDGCLVVDPKKPESAVAHDEKAIRALFAKHKLDLLEPVHYGGWCGRVDGLANQDIVVAAKKHPLR